MAIFIEIDIRYISTFITNAAKQIISVMTIDTITPAKIPSQTFWNSALKITPDKDAASIMLSPAMFNSPA